MKPISDEIQKMMDRRSLSANYTEMVKAAVQDPEVQAFLREHEEDLAQDAVTRGAAKIYEFVKARDSLKTDSPLIAPGYAPKLVAADRLIDISYVPTADKLAADAASSKKRLVTRLNMPKAIESARLSTYDATAGRSAALSAALEFTLGVAREPKAFHKGLYLDGPFGVGKTYLMGAIANELADNGIASTLVHWPTFAVEMKAAIGENKVLPKIERLQKAPVLMIDDIGAEALSPWLRDEVLGVVLQYRMQEELPTLFTSNKTMAELSNTLAGKDIGNNESLKAERIMERVRFLAKEIQVVGENRRY